MVFFAPSFSSSPHLPSAFLRLANDNETNQNNETDASISKIRKERRLIAAEAAALSSSSAAPLPAARARLAAARARLEAASAARSQAQAELDVTLGELAELRTEAQRQRELRDKSGKTLRVEAERRVEELSGEVTAMVVGATREAGGAFLSE